MRGHLLLQLCSDLTLKILNGNTTYGESGDFTLIQPMGNSIIDYVITNDLGARLVSCFQVMCLAQDQNDHTPLELDELPHHRKLTRPSADRETTSAQVALLDSSIDILLQCVLQSRGDVVSCTSALWECHRIICTNMCLC
jgi:hypothetical protein